MKRIICLLAGHNQIPVRAVGVTPAPGGILPSIDGQVAYAPHPEGPHLACLRCRQVSVKASYRGGAA